MSLTWQSPNPPNLPPIRPSGHARATLRAILVTMLLLAGTLVTLLLRLVEHAFFASRRPLSSWFVHRVWRATLRLIGLTHHVEGTQAVPSGSAWQAIVANHVSWLDIIALGAAQPVVFVSKSDVARWPVIGPLARMVGTVFITRNPRDAAAQQHQLSAALSKGHVLAFFPEGTSTDGLRVLPFKSTLMSAFYAHGTPQEAVIQPVSVIYWAPDTQSERQNEARFYGWWGDMALAPHLWRVLAQAPQGMVLVRRHTPVHARDFTDRKALSQVLEQAVRDGMPPDRRACG
ncbi:MAG: lysophospholipid acyltransferase family protein [Pseudomonadota bacterium]